jgi:pimeloyl-ACP methyl ester carboxylesterase
MTEIHRGFAEVNGTRLYYEVAGSGPALALVHGFSLDTRMWDDPFEEFARHYQTVRYDTRGFGKSASPTREPYMDTADLKALLDYLGIARAAVLGLSRGGGIAIDFALVHPEATRALIPVDPTLGGYRWSPAWEASYAPVAARGQAGDIAGAKQLWLAHPLFEPAMANPAVAARLTQMVSDYSGWHWVNADPGRGARPPAATRLDQIRAPTLIVVGERALPDIHRTAEVLQRGIPDTRTIVLPGAGHLPNMEAPQAFNESVRRFLAEALSAPSGPDGS